MPCSYAPTYIHTHIPTGAKSENYSDCKLDKVEGEAVKGLLTSNGGVSPFLVALMEEGGMSKVPSGGAGNKMLMLLEGKGSAYIQDRGVSRWYVCLLIDICIDMLLICV